MSDDVTIENLLADALHDQIDATRDGFNRLEKGQALTTKAIHDTGSASQRDFRWLTFVLLIGLLATVGVNLKATWDSLEVGPAAYAQTVNENP